MIPSGSLTPGIDPGDFFLPAGTALRSERPAAALGGLIASYAVLDSDLSIWNGPSSWLLPGYPQFWFVLTDGTVMVRARKREPAPLGAAMLCGPSSQAMPMTSQGGVSVVVDLTPLGWARWMDQPATTLKNQVVPLERVWAPKNVRDLLGHLHASDRGESVKPILDTFFLATLPRPNRDEPALARLCALLVESDVTSVAEVAERMEVTARTLLRLANAYFGFPPKVLMRRARFLRALIDMMMAGQAPRTNDVPTGYYDASHFARDAYEFLGMTPLRFLDIPMPYLNAVLRARRMVIGSPWPLLDRHFVVDVNETAASTSR